RLDIGRRQGVIHLQIARAQLPRALRIAQGIFNKAERGRAGIFTAPRLYEEGPRVKRWSVVRGLLSSGGDWSDAHVSICLLGEDQRNRMFARGRKSKRAVRPPDEKRRLSERTSPCGKACARSRGRAGGRCRS